MTVTIIATSGSQSAGTSAVSVMPNITSTMPTIPPTMAAIALVYLAMTVPVDDYRSANTSAPRMATPTTAMAMGTAGGGSAGRGSSPFSGGVGGAGGGERGGE